MAFLQKTWSDRISEFPTRRILTKTDSTTETVTVARSEGTISQEGDAFSAENMNGLESRISEAFGNLTADNGVDFRFGYDSTENQYGHKVDGTFFPFGANMRYNEATDMIQIKYNEEWVDWQSANLQALKLYTAGVQNVPFITSEVAATGMTNQNDVVFDISNITIPKATKGKYNGIITNDKIDLSGRTQLIAEIDIDGTSSTQMLNIASVDSAYICLYSFYSTGATAHDFRFRATNARNQYNTTGDNLLAGMSLPTGNTLKIRKLYAK